MKSKFNMGESALKRGADFCAGILVLVGAAVLAGWIFRWPSIFQLHPTFAPMQFNTAACFLLCGVGLSLLNGRSLRWARLPAVIVLVVSVLTLIQYVFSLDFGIDRTVVNSWLTGPRVDYPGRMAILTALQFLIAAVGILLQSHYRERLHPAAAALPAALIGSIAGISILGFILGVEGRYGWGAFTRMALHTSVCFMFFSIGLTLFELSQRRGARSVFWIPVVGAVSLVAVLAAVTQQTLADADASSLGRKRSFDAQMALTELQISASNVQMGARGYVITGDESFLEKHHAGVIESPRNLEQVRVMIDSDDSTIEPILSRLPVDLERLSAWYKKLAEVRREQGATAAQAMVATGEGNRILDQVSEAIRLLQLNEYLEISNQDKDLSNGFRHVTLLFGFASTLSIILIAVSGWRMNVELTLRTNAEKSERELAGFQNAILNSANYALISTRTDGIVTSFNRFAEKLLGYSASEIVGLQTPEIWHDKEEIKQKAAALSLELDRTIPPGFEVFVAKAHEGIVDENEWTFIRRDGSRVPVMLSATAIRTREGNVTGFLGVISDISERKAAEESLKQNLREKEILLKEIHHRVKNNMQIVSSLLNLQAATADDAKFTALIRESQKRVSAMALVHQQLYQAHDLSSVDFKAYTEQLCQSLRASYLDMQGSVELVCKVDKIMLSIDEAIPCALIINECIVNAYKYAFPDKRSGLITLYFCLQGENYCLTVEDNGIGLPVGFDLSNLCSLGLTLIKTLASQLGGKLSYKSSGGAVFEVLFPRHNSVHKDKQHAE